MGELITRKHFDVLDNEELKFIFDQAEKQLKETSENNSLLITRLIPLATVTVTVLIALSGFSVNKWDSNHHVLDPLLKTAIGSLIYFFIIAVFVAIMFLPKVYLSLGSEPHPFFKDDIIKEELKSTLLKTFYAGEIKSYQDRIIANKKTNDTRWLIFNIILIMLIASPNIFWVLYLIFNH